MVAKLYSKRRTATLANTRASQPPSQRAAQTVAVIKTRLQHKTNSAIRP